MFVDPVMNARCPKCRKPIGPTTVTPHPSPGDFASHSFACVDRGENQSPPAKTTRRNARDDAASLKWQTAD
jgi:hypothetical protein